MVEASKARTTAKSRKEATKAPIKRGARNETKRIERPQPKPRPEPRSWFAGLTEAEHERAQLHRALRLYHELLRAAGTTLSAAATTDGVAHADEVEQWIVSTPPVRITRLPTGVSAVWRWLTKDAPKYSMQGFLDHSRTQKRAATLYRSYRRSSHRGSVRRLAERIAKQFHGRSRAYREGVHVLDQLDAWLAGRGPLRTELFQVLLAELVLWEAKRRHKTGGKR